MFSQNAPDTANNNWTVSPKLFDDFLTLSMFEWCVKKIEDIIASKVAALVKIYI